MTDRKALIIMIEEAFFKSVGTTHNRKKMIIQWAVDRSELELVKCLIDIRFNRVKVRELENSILNQVNCL